MSHKYFTSILLLGDVSKASRCVTTSVIPDQTLQMRLWRLICVYTIISVPFLPVLRVRTVFNKK